MALSETEKAVAKRAFFAGFEVSGEGWNGEYTKKDPSDKLNRMFEDFAEDPTRDGWDLSNLYLDREFPR